MKVLIIGATGMLGNAVLRTFALSPDFQAVGTVRNAASAALLPAEMHSHLIYGVDVESTDSVVNLLDMVRPDVVVNCIGLVKQLDEAKNPLAAIPINSLLPHRLARLSALVGARFVHMSTDCVFSGAKGMYLESDHADADDLYGRSKYLGEVDYANSITLRTSIIGHELGGARSLVGWFLAQNGKTRGFKKAIFSGLPTVEIARIIRDFVIPRPEMHGLYHVSAEPVNKFDLLSMVAREYGKKIEIEADEKFVIDRSLDSSRFRAETGFRPLQWPDLVAEMRAFG